MQARYDSFLLDVVTFISATVFLVRIGLGFQRMDTRYRNQVIGAHFFQTQILLLQATATRWAGRCVGGRCGAGLILITR